MSAGQVGTAGKVFTGRDGNLRVGGADGVSGVDVAKVVSFSVQASLETLETTTIGDHLRSYSPGVVGYTGSATLLYYREGPSAFNTTSLLSKIYKSGADGVSSADIVRLTFSIVDGVNNKNIAMNAYVTGASFGAATADIVRAEISFQGTGELAEVTIGDTGAT